MVKSINPALAPLAPTGPDQQLALKKPTMVKRHISSDDEDYSATSSKANQSPKKKKAKSTPSTHDLELEVAVTNKPRPHASETHRIDDPRPIRVSLLEWYSEVHETRGMPWRKPYDASLGRDERAQRAYEVRLVE